MSHARALALALACACACASAHRARERALADRLADYRDQRPMDDVWQDARRLLADRGYPLAARDAAAVGQQPMSWAERLFSPARDTAIEGGQRTLDTGWNRSRERYHVDGRVLEGGSQVTFTQISDALSDRQAVRTRDVELQLELVRRGDPDAAGRIEEGLPAAAAGAR